MVGQRVRVHVNHTVQEQADEHWYQDKEAIVEKLNWDRWSGRNYIIRVLAEKPEWRKNTVMSIHESWLTPVPWPCPMEGKK